jgi:hypothetical protein
MEDIQARRDDGHVGKLAHYQEHRMQTAFDATLLASVFLHFASARRRLRGRTRIPAMIRHTAHVQARTGASMVA